MRKLWTAGVCALVLAGVLAGCSTPDTTGEPISATPSTKTPDVSAHQSGPESPIAYGLQVPKGATQMGPLVRFRSAALIAAYLPELNAAIAQADAEARDKAAQDLKEGKTPSTPAPTPATRPNTDTFKLLDDPPKPDSSVSAMRIDGSPSDVVLRMIGQIAAVLPASGIETDNLAKYCTVRANRITGCQLTVTGHTKSDRRIQVLMTVDPGNVTSRTSPPAADTKPVMTVFVQYIGEPRSGQIGRDTDSSGTLPKASETAAANALIWPKMDVDAPPTSALLNGTWKAPEGATILLSGFHPAFVALTTEKGIQADLISEEYARSAADKGAYTTDIVEDLNEVSTTYTAVRKDGTRAFATFVLSARGSYAMLFSLPKPTL